MSRAADGSGQGGRPKPAGRPTGAPRLTIREMDAQYMALIEELERQVKELERELADCRARATAGDRGARLDIGKVPPTNVTADGTRGMTRGVSGPARPNRGTSKR